MQVGFSSDGLNGAWGQSPDRAATVFLVEDDDRFAWSLELVLGGVGLTVIRYPCAERFLSEADVGERACLLLDVHLPCMSGIELQRQLNERRMILPIVFMSGCGDVPTSVQALKAGAVDFLEKPFSRDALMKAVHLALVREQQLRGEQAARQQTRVVRRRFERLTDREREVLKLVVEDLTSKEVAVRLGVSPRTVEHHREHIMDKLGARSFHHLLLMAVLDGVCDPHRQIPA